MTHDELLSSIRKTHDDGLQLIVTKNKDYAKAHDAFSNFRHSELIGVAPERAILVRIMDKMARIGNCVGRPTEVSDETIEDTLLDAVNYLCILKAYLENERKAH